ncbi:unnamed protein product [Medioppia subpectinata]|uniref:Uncharacterized protein n=1 Tax=Medioppia subpectinata TaxID=1979941 RepID=A0A7R9PUY2_9ACAR|nr:unnamed protein product [Medioppia subpectinata]CAG2102242.1 unnamed protein product [Medioppia subpectinata]
MYKNGKQWKFDVGKRIITMETLTYGKDNYNKTIINRFGVSGNECEIKYQPGSNTTIMTICSDGSEDNTSQYDPKAKENEALRKTLSEKQSLKQSKALLKTPQSRLTDRSAVKTSVVETKRETATQKPNTNSPTKNRKTVSPDKTSPKTVSPDKTSPKSRSPKYFMYSKGYEWNIGFGNNDFDHKGFIGTYYDRNIIKRFSGNGVDCYVKYQSGNTGDVVTNCTDGKTINNIDADSQYNPKGLIFRANKRDDNWLIVYNKTVANIWCYSPNKSPNDRLVKNETKCRANVNQSKLFVDSMDPLRRKDIEAVVDIAIGNKIFVYYIFFNINGKPMYCSQSLGGSECNSSLKYLLPECFPPPPTAAPTDLALWAKILIGLGVVGLVYGAIFVYEDEDEETASQHSNNGDAQPNDPPPQQPNAPVNVPPGRGRSRGQPPPQNQGLVTTDTITELTTITDKAITDKLDPTRDADQPQQHSRVARHQTDKPVDTTQRVTDKQSQTDNGYDKPDVSDQNVDEITAQTDLYHRTTKTTLDTNKRYTIDNDRSDQDLSTSDVNTVTNGRIVTKCTDDIQGDTESQYDPKAIIFRPSTYMANPWVLIYSQNKSFPNISCYSPKVIDTPRLVNDRTKCWKLAEIESLFLDSMEDSLKKSIEEKQSIKQSKALLKIPQSRLTEKSSVKTPVVETKRRTATQKPKTKSPTKDQKTVSPDKTSPKTVSPDKTSSKTRSPKVKN